MGTAIAKIIEYLFGDLWTFLGVMLFLGLIVFIPKGVTYIRDKYDLY